MNTSPSPINHTTTVVTVWAIAALAGILAIALMIFFGDFGYTGPVALGGLIFLGLGLLLQFMIADLPPPPAVGAFDVAGAKPAEVPQSTKSPAQAKLAESSSAARAAVKDAASDVAEVVKEKATAAKDTVDAAVSKVEEKAHAAKAAVTGANSDEPGKPKLLSAAREGKPDDLKQIKGVGPKLEQMLHKMGVYHFDQVSSWSEAEVAWVDENLEGFKGRVSRDGWVDQAKILAAGGETEFSKRN